MACIAMLNKIGLSTDPCCNPTLTSKVSLSSPFILTDVVTPLYMLLITFTIHSSTPTYLRAHHSTSRGTLSKAFSKSTKAIHNSFCLPRNFSWTCRTIKMASVFPLPGLNPNWIASIFTIFLIRASKTLSNTFNTCSSSFIPLYELHSRAFPLPLYTFTIQLLFQSNGTIPPLTTSLQISVTHLTPASPAAFNISTATPDGPAALPLFAVAIANLTSSTDITLSSTGVTTLFISSWALATTLLDLHFAFLYASLSTSKPDTFHNSYALLFSLTASSVSLFHHHVIFCLAFPFVLPHSVSVSSNKHSLSPFT